MVERLDDQVQCSEIVRFEAETKKFADVIGNAGHFQSHLTSDVVTWWDARSGNACCGTIGRSKHCAVWADG